MSLLLSQRPSDQAELENFGVDWVVHYQFDDVEISKATSEYEALIHDLHEAHLETQVRHGHGASVLIFIRVPRAYLGNLVHQSRVKDWLYGIIHELPVGDNDTIADAETPAEALRSVYHAVTWKKSLGGAHITPKHGKWKNIASAFPLHDQAANAELLRKWSKTILLMAEDLDAIRALFGEKVAFYFAFIQSYSLFLVFPAAWGMLCWYYSRSYSITFAVGNCLWAMVFVEYWKIRETDLSLRWQVNGVGALKVTRTQYVWEKEVRDKITGEVTQIFSPYRQFLRQLLLVPFTSIASLALGGLIVVTFALEVFISEVYTGSLKGYLEFLPTILFSLCLPSITNLLTRIATRLTKYENYRTQDQYDLAQTAKQFVMHFITAFLPTILTAFVYVPFGARIVPYLNIAYLRGKATDVPRDFHVDPSRLQQEVIYLSLTGQVLSFGEEVVLPYVKRIAMEKWRDYRSKQAVVEHRRNVSQATNQVLVDEVEESAFLSRVRSEAEAVEYNVHEDTLEMCVQFGYLTLFGVSWPLVALGFLVNNWLELRGDFFKLSVECQRPPPIRADSIGPSLQGLEVLSWLGTLSTAAIVYLYRDGMTEIHLSSFLLTILLAEWAYLGMRYAVSTGLAKILSSTLRRESAKRYAVRKGYLEASVSSGPGGSPPRGKLRVRFRDKVTVYTSATDPPSPQSEEELHEATLDDSERRFWSGNAVEDGLRMIKALGTSAADSTGKMRKEL
ncbi:calcium-activated chloride channel-domain-containing protein [Aspergillus cavernicola]|uniref:Calcium-activated chloride channel-domain-containing protein n=1 Tax=Aspergillus cavernicola TaxID=176166 RepID=A0ABR4J0I0_9EURO